MTTTNNTKKTKGQRKAMSEITRSVATPIMHRVVEFNDLIFLGGVAADTIADDMHQQATEVFEKIDRLLRAHGSSKDRLLSVTVYVSDMQEKAAMNDAWNSWLDQSILPCRATIGVADLGAGVLIEVVATAARGSSS